MTQTEEQASIAFLDWLHEQVVAAGRGDNRDVMPEEPRGSFWLGRLACEAPVQGNQLGARGERLDPCAIDIRVRPKDPTGPWHASIAVRLRTWTRQPDGTWRKD